MIACFEVDGSHRSGSRSVISPVALMFVSSALSEPYKCQSIAVRNGFDVAAERSTPADDLDIVQSTSSIETISTGQPPVAVPVDAAQASRGGGRGNPIRRRESRRTVPKMRASREQQARSPGGRSVSAWIRRGWSDGDPFGNTVTRGLYAGADAADGDRLADGGRVCAASAVQTVSLQGWIEPRKIRSCGQNQQRRLRLGGLLDHGLAPFAYFPPWAAAEPGKARSPGREH